MTLASKGQVFDARVCGLGESPLWHPERGELYWIDIPAQTLMAAGPRGEFAWPMAEMISALAWVDRQHLLLASETGLKLFAIETGHQTEICPLEADQPQLRSNDGRADPWGGFWIGTMHKEAEAGCGSLYRWYDGRLQRITAGLTISNGLCFDRAQQLAYYADSACQRIYRQALHPETGWPVAEAEGFLDLAEQGWVPDGAVVDADGCLWVALFDAGCVARFSPSGELLGELPAGTPRPTCPAFGGEGAGDLYLTTASWGLTPEQLADGVGGTTLVFPNCVRGVPEPRVLNMLQS